MSLIKNYLSLIKFSHTIFAMPFAMIGFFLAVFKPPLYGTLNETMDLSTHLSGQVIIKKLALVIACMVMARSAAMAFNRYLDRHFDAKNPRTAIREIPAGIISADRALLFTIICSLLFVVCSWLINPLCFFLSPIALLVILGYSFTKRFTALCHLVLGLGLSLAPIGSYLAVTGTFNWLPILFSFAVIFWVSGFDIIYALQDEEFDRSQELHSIPAAIGRIKALRVSEFLHSLSATAVVLAGIYGQFGWWYWLGVLIFTGMLLYQHSIVKPNDLSRVNIAFMTANGIASVVFAGFVITDLIVH
ncbi:UbiA-like polyprenyltransferase [Flavihumibacter profundi]|uniref:UbiA-like polyprenyltransferase n=1 Tax=Flavihumibacter profundi TaxID=2716883 RepID=UPI001CC42BEC|nr:UbiA-like polyprenyltransferase [Flavihumibacter profundi]MBZ5856535.1 putative 4-hydroxybenzoate polyprenyltransferase [Flavihumibacter profundi]